MRPTMYQEYWKLNQRPFDDGGTPDLYYPAQSHQAALLKLRYLIEQQKGAGVIIGDHGVGKSFLGHVIEREESDRANSPFIRLVIPALPPLAMLTYFARQLETNLPGDSAAEDVLFALERKFIELNDAGKAPVLFVDDAHLLSMEHLNLLRLLLNIRESGMGQFTLILSGRNDLLGKIKRIKSLDQRIPVRACVKPLQQDEIADYIGTRIEATGGTNCFQAQAVHSIWQLSQGIPRQINQICDLALLIGYVDNLDRLSPIEVQAAAEEISSVS